MSAVFLIAFVLRDSSAFGQYEKVNMSKNTAGK
jgi:hypothetical protein